MKTNQLMNVRLGIFGTVEIFHKTQMGKVSDIMAIGNLQRELKGLRIIKIEEILRTQSFWEFVVSCHNAGIGINSNSVVTTDLKNMDNSNSAVTAELKNMENSKCVETPTIKIDFDSIKDKDNKIQYSKLINKFPHLIQSKKGRYGGTYMHLYLLLEVATRLDSDLKVEIYKTFIEGKILEHRDAGGEAFKRLNKAIDTLPDRQPHLKPKGNKGVYINVAKMIREKLAIIDTKGYNEDEHDKIIQEKREEYINKLVTTIELGLVTSYPQLKEVIKKL